jgi:hypothetical protein
LSLGKAGMTSAGGRFSNPFLLSILFEQTPCFYW